MCRHKFYQKEKRTFVQMVCWCLDGICCADGSHPKQVIIHQSLIIMKFVFQKQQKSTESGANKRDERERRLARWNLFIQNSMKPDNLLCVKGKPVAVEWLGT